MTVTVTDECGAGPAARADMDQAVKDVVGAVEEISGLCLPDTVHLRMVTPQALKDANRQMLAAMFAAMAQRHPDLPPKSVQVTRTGADAAIRITTMFWRGLGGQYFPRFPGGAPAQVMVMPQALRLSRANSYELRVIAAHELTHAAQDRALPLMSVDAAARVVAIPAKDVRARKGELAQVSPAMEGHAQWVHMRVMRELFGIDVRERAARFDGKGAWSYRLSQAVAARMPLTARKSADYDSGETFIDAVHAAGGLSLVNRMWRGLDAIPNAAELASPALWIERVGG